MGLPLVVQKGNTERYPTDGAATFIGGALVYADTGPVIKECGTDPALILGAALNDAGQVPDTTNTLVSLAAESSRWWMGCSSTPTIANANQEYGVTKGSDGNWYVDFTKTGGSARVYVYEVDTYQNRVKVSVLEANRQSAP